MQSTFCRVVEPPTLVLFATLAASLFTRLIDIEQHPFFSSSSPDVTGTGQCFPMVVQNYHFFTSMLVDIVSNTSRIGSLIVLVILSVYGMPCE